MSKVKKIIISILFILCASNLIQSISLGVEKATVTVDEDRNAREVVVANGKFSSVDDLVDDSDNGNGWLFHINNILIIIFLTLLIFTSFPPFLILFLLLNIFLFLKLL